MKRSLPLITGLALALSAMLALPACKTDQEGVKSTYRSQYGTVAANVEDSVAAAESALKSLNLKDIDSSHTGVDGQAVGYLADKTKVTVSVERATDKTSEVTVNVGTLGDPDLGKEILSKIHKAVTQ